MKVDCTKWYNRFLTTVLPGVFTCKDVGPQPDPGAPQPIKLAHGAGSSVPLQDKSNRPHGQEKIHRLGPFDDFRVLEIGDDAFLDDFILAAVRQENGYLVGDDLAHSGVIYVFDHWSIHTSTNNTPTNPLPLAGVDTSTFRAWWRCHRTA